MGLRIRCDALLLSLMLVEVAALAGTPKARRAPLFASTSDPDANMMPLAAQLEPLVAAGRMSIQQLAAVIASTPDPTKDKVVPPRGPDGKILKWVEGMAPCPCAGKKSGDKGQHLMRDCTDTWPERAGGGGGRGRGRVRAFVPSTGSRRTCRGSSRTAR